MHYTGMTAATFSPTTSEPDLSHAVNISHLGLVSIVVVTFFVLGMAVLTRWWKLVGLGVISVWGPLVQKNMLANIHLPPPQNDRTVTFSPRESLYS
jgi:hypothetical protein